MVRLLKPIEYYAEKYGTEFYGLNKLYLLMEKQHNRGQEAAGLGCIKLHATPGNEFAFRERGLGTSAIQDIFANVRHSVAESEKSGMAGYELPFVGEIYMGHLRYSTTGKSGLSYVHPFLRRNNWRNNTLMLCGNFNMTNVEEIFAKVVSEGQHPRLYSDTFMLLEQLGHSLDHECGRLYDEYKSQGYQGLAITEKIEANIDLMNVIGNPARSWDGGFVICGIVGSGDMFALRDKNGIRPAFYYCDEEIVVVASERPVIQTTMNVAVERVKELTPGSALTVNKAGEVKVIDVLGEGENQRCSFERIYFSRGSDADIYNERKQLGRNLVPKILEAVGHDYEHTVLSFIPNTAEVAYLGMIDGMTSSLNEQKLEQIKALDATAPDYGERFREIMRNNIRVEKLAIKDIKLRTFIAEGESRNDLAAHVYDVTYGIVEPGVDNVVVIDDSIVRGTTLKQSIIRILDRLHPKKIVVVSSSPQVRYPDYYGIDMSRMTEFCAFRAAIELLKERGMENVIDEVYRKCKAQEGKPKDEIVNYVTENYAPFSDEDVASKITEMLTPAGTEAEVELIFQSVEGLRQSCPNHPGDWYFSGHYPTPGGNMMVNKAFINFYEGNPLKR